MVRLVDVPEPERSHLADMECPTFDTRPWVAAPPLNRRRVAIISTAGLQRRGDRPFGFRSTEYRVILEDGGDDIVMSHVSTNFDRSGFQQDLNVIFPLDRLRELAADGVIGSVAKYHYSFMGATEPTALEPVARELAGMLKEDRVNAVLLAPI